MDWGEDGWGHNGQQPDPFIGAPGSRKTVSSVIGNKDLCLYLEGIATYKISSFLLYQILNSCNKVQLNYFKIIEFDFLWISFRFGLSQLKIPDLQVGNSYCI